ncbi:MAG: nucleotide exchange factor GrpE [Actinobacteria bacterium]|nr:nucleotide exchange factor GrpE [Actinomycetota bacterium]MBI3686479.1 nucleotide exchange factor GrpE [Actinomycetota bacterium]
MTESRFDPNDEPQPVVIRDKRRIDPVSGQVRTPHPSEVWTPPTGPPAAGSEPAGTEPGGDAAVWRAGDAAAAEDPAVAELTAQLSERTADLQRVTAEYANYRKRVERDRALTAEVAIGTVLSALLPVLDDLDRARAHGDLTGAFKAVADQLAAVLERLGLVSFGALGDRFDPTVHEAVSHSVSDRVGEPTCVGIMRCGYSHRERLLRPALVAVADPAGEPPLVAADNGDGDAARQ